MNILKNIFLSLLLAVPSLVLAQTEDLPLPKGLTASPLVCKRNSAKASLTSADGDASSVGWTSTGGLLTGDVVAEDSAIASGHDMSLTGGVYRTVAQQSAGTDGDASASGYSSMGGLWVSIIPGGSYNGWTPSLKNGLSNTASAVKASSAQFGGFYCYNPNASVAYVQVYNLAAASVTVGTSTPSLSFGIPASAGAVKEFVNGVGNFGTALSVAATTTATGATAPGAALDCNIFYK